MYTSEFVAIIKKIAPIFGEPQKIFYAQHKPEPNSKLLCCFDNADNKAKKDGGGILYGWTFTYKINPAGRYVVANYHAVWFSPNSLAIDVTPYSKDIPFSKNGKILFLAIKNSKPIDTGKSLIPHPNKYFPIDNNLELVKHLVALTEKEEKEVADICKADYETK